MMQGGGLTLFRIPVTGCGLVFLYKINSDQDRNLSAGGNIDELILLYP